MTIAKENIGRGLQSEKLNSYQQNESSDKQSIDRATKISPITIFQYKIYIYFLAPIFYVILFYNVSVVGKKNYG